MIRLVRSRPCVDSHVCTAFDGRTKQASIRFRWSPTDLYRYLPAEWLRHWRWYAVTPTKTKQALHIHANFVPSVCGIVTSRFVTTTPLLHFLMQSLAAAAATASWWDAILVELFLCFDLFTAMCPRLHPLINYYCRLHITFFNRF